MTKGLWLAIAIASLAGTGFAWYRSEIRLAEERGKAKIMVQQADSLRHVFDSAATAHDLSERAASERLARLAQDSASNAGLRRVLSAAASSATQRADSILSLFGDSLPQLAGVRAALDTLDQLAMAERRGRIVAEEMATELSARLGPTLILLAQAKRLIAEQAATIEQLKKTGSSGGGLSPLDVVVGVVVVAGSIALGAVAF